MSQPHGPDTRSWPRRHKVTTGVIAVLGLSAVGHLVDDGSGGKAQSASVSAAPVVKKSAPATTPNVVGMSFGEAQSKLDKLGIKASSKDGSPLGRQVVENKDLNFTWGDWIVISSSVKTGAPAPSVKMATLTVLKKQEAAWFKKHPTMPAIPAGSTTGDLTGDGNLFDGMDELVDYRYPKNHTPSSASDPMSGTLGYPATPMLPSETAPVKGLKNGLGASEIVGTYPVAGGKLRPGRLVYVLVRDRYAESLDSEGDSSSSVDGNVHDYDMPNHLPHVHGHHHWGGGHSWWH